jgi:hypothetical protein
LGQQWVERTRRDSDDEHSHCSTCGRELGNCDIRRANPGGRALRRLRDRRRRTAGRCAPRLCVLPLWGTAARAELLLVPPAGLRRLRQHGRVARTSSGVLLLVGRLSSVATALIAHQARSFVRLAEVDQFERPASGGCFGSSLRTQITTAVGIVCSRLPCWLFATGQRNRQPAQLLRCYIVTKVARRVGRTVLPDAKTREA